MADIRYSTDLLDDFNYVLSPLPAPWADSGVSSQLEAQGQIAVGLTGAAHDGHMYWSSESFNVGDGAIQAWGVRALGNAPGIAWSLDFLQFPGPNGYWTRQEVSTGGGGVNNYKVTNGVSTALGGGTGTGPTGGGANTLMFAQLDASGNLDHYYTIDGGANWTQVGHVVDTTYTGTFYIGIGLHSNASLQELGWNNFGGGQLPEAPQIYRRPTE